MSYPALEDACVMRPFKRVKMLNAYEYRFLTETRSLGGARVPAQLRLEAGRRANLDQVVATLCVVAVRGDGLAEVKQPEHTGRPTSAADPSSRKW